MDETADRPSPRAAELVSLAERLSWLGGVRVAFAAVVVLFELVAPATLGASAPELLAGCAAYALVLGATPWAVPRVSRRAAQWVLGASLLLDGVFLAWVAYATGGTRGPLRFLVLVHVVAVTLLASYRTGLKLAAWHSILYLVALYAQSSGIVPIREGSASSLPGGDAFARTAILHVSALWFVALVTATCAAVIERELRGQKVDLEELSALVRELDRPAAAADVPRVLLDALCRVFGARRGVVLASPDGDLAVMAERGAAAAATGPPGRDRIVELAWDSRTTQLVRRLDPDADRRLSALLPGARDVLVVPLSVDRGFRLGVVALEFRARRHRLKRWVVTLVEQFASHAALTLRNAWLREEVERRLAENRELQGRLLAQNLELEIRVEERTAELAGSLHDLQVADDQRRLLLERLVHAEEEERRKIAGDIHDDPIQKLVAVNMRLQLLRRIVHDPAQLAEVDTSVDVLRTTIQSLRHMIFELRPHALDELGLGPALQDYLESLDAGFAYTVDVRTEREPDPEMRVVLYRMAQEALANVRKHANADRVDVLLGERDGGFVVRITDDGVGFASPATLDSPRGHLGLTSMRERAEMAGGWCRLLSLPGEGTTVEFWVPGTLRDVAAHVPSAPIASQVRHDALGAGHHRGW